MNLETVLRRTLIGIGLVAFVVGAVGMYGGGLPLPFGGLGVVLVGALSVLLGIVSVRARLRGDLTETEMPDPELPASHPPPGDEVDQQFYEMIELQHGMTENREQITERLRAAAIRTIRQRDDCSRQAAIAQIETGEWTDNEAAASFFTEENVEEGEGSALDVIMARSGESEAFKRRVDETVDAIAELGGIEFERRPSSESSSLFDSLRSRVRGESEDETQKTNVNVAGSSIDSFDTDEAFVDLGVHETNRWLGVSAFALLAVGIGTFAYRPGLLLAGIVGIAYAAYGRATLVPETQNLAVERTLSDENPKPEDEIQITVTLRNDGDSTLFDLRLVDVVPDPFVVTRGSPRLCTALRPGEEASMTYTVLVERGQYNWPVLAAARDVSGSTERESLHTPEETLVCKPTLDARVDMPVRAQTTQYSGDVETDRGGAGLEFHSVRDYRQGDPMNRINWKRYARTGDFATIDFRQEKAATITLLFDTRERAFTSSGPGRPNAVNLSVHAATDVFASLYEAGNLVGLAAFDTVPCWMSPGAGSDHLEQARMLFATHPALSPIPPSRADVEGSYIDPMTHVRRQLPSNSQVFLFTPLSDDYAAETARRLDSAGHLVTIISPDTTNDETVGQRLATIERHLRLGELRERGIRAIDWDPNDQLRLQFERAQARWA